MDELEELLKAIHELVGDDKMGFTGFMDLWCTGRDVDKLIDLLNKYKKGWRLVKDA